MVRMIHFLVFMLFHTSQQEMTCPDSDPFLDKYPQATLMSLNQGLWDDLLPHEWLNPLPGSLPPNAKCLGQAVEITCSEGNVPICLDSTQFCLPPDTNPDLGGVLPIFTTHGIYNCKEATKGDVVYYALGLVKDGDTLFASNKFKMNIQPVAVDLDKFDPADETALAKLAAEVLIIHRLVDRVDSDTIRDTDYVIILYLYIETSDLKLILLDPLPLPPPLDKNATAVFKNIN